MTTFLEQFLGMRFLEIPKPDFRRWNLRRDGKNRHMIAMTVEKTVDQMQVARPATACAHGKLARHRGIGARCEGRDFLVTGMHPTYGAHAPQAVARDAPDALDAGRLKGLG